MKITIVGAGFCGLAAAWHCLNRQSDLPSMAVRLIDANGIGGGASGIAAGLLHPFVGAHSKLNWMGREGFQATVELLEIASKALNKPVYRKEKGILRLALTPDQEADYQRCADRYPLDVEWLNAERSRSFFPWAVSAPGLWIKNGITVHASLYLQGLWKACEQRGAKFEAHHIHSLTELKDTDVLILTIGAAARYLPELSDLPLKAVKGQVIELTWPADIPPLPCALNSKAYILMSENKQTCLVGATYEKGYKTEACQPEIAVNEIMPKACAILPFLQESQLINCYAGLRCVTANHLPLIHSLAPNQWVLTGMGSKGLLYHSLMAKQLVDQIFPVQ